MILCTLILNRLILCFLEIDFQILSNAAAVTVGFRKSSRGMKTIVHVSSPINNIIATIYYHFIREIPGTHYNDIDITIVWDATLLS